MGEIDEVGQKALNSRCKLVLGCKVQHGDLCAKLLRGNLKSPHKKRNAVAAW